MDKGGEDEAGGDEYTPCWIEAGDDALAVDACAALGLSTGNAVLCVFPPGNAKPTTLR
jgi:hypothetical protein